MHGKVDQRAGQCRPAKGGQVCHGRRAQVEHIEGKITQWTEPEQPADPAKDRRVTFGCYSVSVNDKDGGIWCAGIGPRDNKLVRIERGPNPPLSCKAEVYEPPPGRTPEVFRSGGVSVDSNGIVWLNWRGTDYMTSFDRSKCKTLNGPQATGQHCPEGWTVHIKPGPTFEVVARNPLGEPCFSSPAISDGRIFVRGARHLFCFADKR